MAKNFVHLHVHTEYSLLDGLSKISKLLNRVKESGMDSVAITDHGAMYGVIEFYKKCIKEEVKPIIGMEGYTTNVGLKERPERSRVKNFHLLLLAKNNEGYENLMKLTSIAHIEGYYYRPRIDKETLAKYSKGLICTSACPLGEVPQFLIDGDYKSAKDKAIWFLDVFGKDYYLEVQRHDWEKYAKATPQEERKKQLLTQADTEKAVNEGVMKLSRDLGIPIIATNDAHYVRPEDAEAQDALVCIATGKNVSDTKRLRFIDSPTFYIKTPEEMSELFSDLPEAIENTTKIAKVCDVSIPLDKWYFPKYVIEKGVTAEKELEMKTYKGAKLRLSKLTKDVKERLDYELKTIEEKGYSPYFLIVADVAQWCRRKGIITNTRGSTAGSLVAFALGIVDINPLKYDLPFERFLTPWRPSPPDIDFDIADDRREEVVNYLVEKYGKEKVAQICTFGRMLARGAVRDVARVLGYPYATGDRIAKSIPIGSQGFPMTIKKALEVSHELKNMYEEQDDAKKIIDMALRVEGSARHISIHAAGVVIAPQEITNFTPIQLDPEGKKIITQYDMDALDPNVSPNEAVGLLKFDLLGLRNLSILGAAIDTIKEELGIQIKLIDIPIDDKKTFEMLSKGETMGVFQLSGGGMTKYLKDLKPTRVEDLMAMVALYRPGPMAQIPEYIERKNNPAKIKYFDERMKEYLGKSYGLLVYQDDVFATAIKIAGYTWEEADKFRKAVGKKIPLEMEKQKEKFIKGAVDSGMDKKKAGELFKLIEPFSGYGFNKAHAASYGLVAYWTAYMKANYPVEFMCALMSAESNDNEKVATAVNECRRIGITVLSPDINKSGVGFEIVKEKSSLEGKGIRFGLNAIKNVGKAAIEAILEERKQGAFVNFVDFLSRVDARRVNKKVLESLIKVGAMSSFGSRVSLLANVDNIRSKVTRPKSADNQQGLFAPDEIKKSSNLDNSDLQGDASEFTDEEIQNLERQLLGFSLSAKPISEILSPLEHLATHKIQEIFHEEIYLENVRIVAIVDEVRVIITKKGGQEMAFVKAKDETGTIDLVVFPKIFESTRNFWVDNKPLVVSGKLDARGDEPALIVNQISASEMVEEKEKLFIKIPSGAKEENLVRLKKVLNSHPGSQKVTLVFSAQKTVELPIEVSWSKELAQEISESLNLQALD